MMKMAVEKVMKELNVPVSDIHHCSISEGKSAASQYDIAFVAQNFLDMFKDAKAKGTTVIGLRNVMSAPEVKEKLLATGLVPQA
jgi:PTS system ascorbate-specific IIB component